MAPTTSSGGKTDWAKGKAAYDARPLDRGKTDAAPRPDEPIDIGAGGPVDDWVVVTEYAVPDNGPPPRLRDIEAILEQLAGWQPSALLSTDRYAIGMRIQARAPHLALRWAMAYHAEAVASAGMPLTAVVRVEVMSAEEMERSWDADDVSALPAEVGDASAGVLGVDLYMATRSLVAAATTRQVADIVGTFVRAVGGRVEPGAPRRLPGATEVDITIHADRPCYATGDSVSVTGLILERSLPMLLSDARIVLGRLDRLTPNRLRSPDVAPAVDPR